MWKLRRAAKSAIRGVGAIQQMCGRLAQVIGADADLARQHTFRKPQPAMVALAVEIAKCLRLLLDLIAMGRIVEGKTAQDRGKSGHAVAIFGWKVRTRIEG